MNRQVNEFVRILSGLGRSFGDCPRLVSRSSLQLLVIMAMGLTLAACGGSDSADDGNAQSGELVVGITDAEGDFLSYEVEVTSILLHKANGTSVETVPLATRIDFAEYADMTEFFTIATVPAGVYTSATLRVDYSDARVVIEDSLGGAVAATIVDANGDAVIATELSIQFAGNHPLLIKPGVPANLMVDFDLAASHEVIGFDPATVELDPTIVADVQWQTPREHRARGLLAGVDIDNSRFTLKLRPFRHRHHDFGRLAVAVNDDTWYQINGETYSGADGLTALAGLADATPVISFGEVQRSDDARSFTASRVIAGTSIPWVNRDTAAGTVVSRDGDVLTIKGRFYDHETARMLFNSQIKVTISDTTQFSRQAISDEYLDKSSVSVGQRVVVVGDASFAEPSPELDENLLALLSNRLADETGRDYRNALGERNHLATRCQLDSVIDMDATSGYLRLRLTAVLGSVVETQALALDLQAINSRAVSNYDFAGTGVEAQHDADPHYYQIDTQSLSLPALVDEQWLKVLGFVAPFGSAPADFVAHTVIDPALNPQGAALLMHWPQEADNPLTSIGEDALVIDSSEARHFVNLYGYRWNDQAVSYTLIPAQERGLYSIKLRSARQMLMFRNFADFSAALEEHMLAGAAVRRLHARGRYDIEAKQLSVATISVILQ